MAALIKGIDVTLYEKTDAGTDAFNQPIYTQTPVVVHNVLVAPVQSVAITDTLRLHGKRIEYELSIPKGDAHSWEDSTVEFFGEQWRTVGFVERWLEDRVPLDWNGTIKVERYG